MNKLIFKIRKWLKLISPKRENKIMFICDRKKCVMCNEECKHTTDISHAKNFIKIPPDGYYWEEDENGAIKL